MSGRLLTRSLAAGAMAAAAVVALQVGVSEERRQAAPAPSAGLTEQLGGAERYLTHVLTDKPVYRPGEKVYIRGIVLRADTRAPLPAEQQLQALVEIKGPKGDTVAQGWAASQDAAIGFAWEVPQGQAGGEYTARVTHPWTGHAPAERKFDVRAYRAPRLKSQIVFVRDGYGPGDAVSASCHVERAEGGIPEGAKVTLLGRVDGRTVFEGQTTVGPDGNCFANFELPEEIARGEGTLAFVVEDGGAVETASKTIPILLQTVDLQMYPEGGDLVAGLEGRLYVEAKTPARKPADIAGEIVNAKGEAVAAFRTEHEGRGRVAFTPQAGETYGLRISEPAGIKTRYPLPEVKQSGVVLRSTADVADAGAAVTLQVASTKAQTLTVTLSRREREVASQNVKVDAGRPATVKLDAKDADGVLVATVNDNNGRPLAERLVFRRPKESVRVEIKPDRDRYVPGQEASLTIKTTGADGKPVSALVGVTVTDDSVLEMIEKREQAPRLPVMVLLEPEVRELADAHVYLDGEDPEAPLATDLLLGTQGWRRFALAKLPDFLAAHGDKARRVLALTMATRREFDRAAGRGGVPFGGEAGNAARFPAPAAARDGAAVPDAAALPRGAAAPAPAEVAEKFAEQRNEAKDAGAGAKEANQPEEPQASRQAQLGQALEKADAKREADELLVEEELAQVGRGGRARRLMAGGEPLANFMTIREYAHAARPDRRPGERTDFTETLYWNAGVRTDEKTGEATVKFALNDSVTSFRVLADAVATSGALGSGTAFVESVEPFYAEPKLPLEVTSSDTIRLPLGLVNSTADPLSEVRVAVEAQGLPAVEVGPFALGPDGRVRRIVEIPVGTFSGSTDLTLRSSAGPYKDAVTRKLTVKPLGFPVQIARGGMLFPDESVKHEVVIPDHVVPGSLTASVSVFPTPLANMTEALQALIREPSGCFEQTSSTTYPLVMAQQYFTTHAGVDPRLVQRSGEMLGKGYERLVGYECKQGGYEWFGEDPGHEALTAFGLMEFRDMSRVRDVDAAMLERTRKWLLGRRDGKGGFTRERRALHTWEADPEVSNAYITWALLSAGEKSLEPEVAWVKDAAAKTKNSYVVALAANVLLLSGDTAGATELLDRLIPLQTSTGDIQGATVSIVGSGGEALAIETTALATLAWLSDRDYADFADKGVRYLTGMCRAGRFGSTQSTVLALKAIVEQDKALARPKSPGSVQLVVDGRSAGEPIPFGTDTQGAIRLPEFAELLKPGKHTLEVRMADGSAMPYAVAVELHSTRPASSDECKVDITVSLADKAVNEGAVTEARVTVKNAAKETVPTPVAIVGLPGGLEPRHDQLKELVKSKKIAAYEVLGREVVLYWRALEPGEAVELPLSLVAAVPGQYTGPASRAYLYYTDEHKRWADPLAVEIRPAAE